MLKAHDALLEITSLFSSQGYEKPLTSLADQQKKPHAPCGITQ